jgi:hypothetical protein
MTVPNTRVFLSLAPQSSVVRCLSCKNRFEADVEGLVATWSDPPRWTSLGPVNTAQLTGDPAPVNPLVVCLRFVFDTAFLNNFN